MNKEDVIEHLQAFADHMKPLAAERGAEAVRLATILALHTIKLGFHNPGIIKTFEGIRETGRGYSDLPPEHMEMLTWTCIYLRRAGQDETG